MSEMDYHFAVVADDLASETFKKVDKAAKRSSDSADKANKGMARYADQARKHLEKILGPARALAPEIDGLAQPLVRTLKAAGLLGTAFQPAKAQKASSAFRDTARASGALDAATQGAATKGLPAAVAGLGATASGAKAASGALAGATTEAGAAEVGMGALGISAAGVATGIGAVVVAAGAAEVAMAKFISPFARGAQQLDIASQTVGMAAQNLQAFRGASELAGVSADATTQAIANLGGAIHRVQYGAGSAEDIMALRLAGIQAPQRGQAVDMNAAILQAADAIKAQKDPYAQQRLAGLLGVGGALPFFRQGSGAIQKDVAQYNKTGDVYTPGELAAGVSEARAQTNWNQATHGLGKGAAMAAAGQSEAALNATAGAITGVEKPHPVQSGVGAVTGAVGSAMMKYFGLADAGGSSAAPASTGAAAKAAPAVVAIARTFAADAWDMLTGIVQQESHGAQSDGHGHITRSNKGAIGAAQMLPETAERAAAWAGIKWDPKRFYDPNDKAYSQSLGAAELQRLLTKFNGDRVLAAAAYNAGSGRLEGVDRNGRHTPGWLERFGDPRKGEISDLDFARRIPFAETRDYVMRTQFGASGARTPAAAVAQQAVRGEILVKVTAPPSTKVVTSSSGPLSLLVSRTADFLSNK